MPALIKAIGDGSAAALKPVQDHLPNLIGRQRQGIVFVGSKPDEIVGQVGCEAKGSQTGNAELLQPLIQTVYQMTAAIG